MLHNLSTFVTVHSEEHWSCERTKLKVCSHASSPVRLYFELNANTLIFGRHNIYHVHYVYHVLHLIITMLTFAN